MKTEKNKSIAGKKKLPHNFFMSKNSIQEQWYSQMKGNEESLSLAVML